MYLFSPGFGHNHLPLMDLHSKTMPKVVATKMLSASSIHPKMQMELGKTRYGTDIIYTVEPLLADSSSELTSLIHAAWSPFQAATGNFRRL